MWDEPTAELDDESRRKLLEFCNIFTDPGFPKAETADKIAGRVRTAFNDDEVVANDPRRATRARLQDSSTYTFSVLTNPAGIMFLRIHHPEDHLHYLFYGTGNKPIRPHGWRMRKGAKPLLIWYDKRIGQWRKTLKVNPIHPFKVAMFRQWAIIDAVKEAINERAGQII